MHIDDNSLPPWPCIVRAVAIALTVGTLAGIGFRALGFGG